MSRTDSKADIRSLNSTLLHRAQKIFDATFCIVNNNIMLNKQLILLINYDDNALLCFYFYPAI